MILIKNKWFKWVISIILTIVIVYLTTGVYLDSFRANCPLCIPNYERRAILRAIIFQGIPTFLITVILFKKLETVKNFTTIFKLKVVNILSVVLIATFFLLTYQNYDNLIEKSCSMINSFWGGTKGEVKFLPYPIGTEIFESRDYFDLPPTISPSPPSLSENSYLWGYLCNLYFWLALYCILSLKLSAIKKDN